MTGTPVAADTAAMRRAATKMRAAARQAMTGDGPSLSSRWFHDRDFGRYDVIAEDEGSIIAQHLHRAQAAHIAGMDPATALALADWLDYAADPGNALGRHRDLALTIARTYLGDI